MTGDRTPSLGSDRPKIEYARAEDGTSLAYSVFGSGELTILLAFSSFISHLERDWDHPGRTRFYEMLGGFARVIVTDRRNMGMSDPGRPTGSLETIASDLCAVLDATGTATASLISIGSGLALGLPALAPERVDRVVLHNAPPAWTTTPDYAHGYPQPALDEWLENHEATVADPDTEQWAAIGGLTPAQVGLSPGNSASHQRWLFATDACAHVTRMPQPTLVIRTDGSTVLPGATDWMVDHLQDPTRVNLEGSQEPYLRDDLDVLVGTIEEFLTGRRTSRAGERRLATVVFTDIVGSTALAADLGPAAWRRRLDEHDQITRRTIHRHGGTYVKSTGDGALAVFPVPDAAVAAIAELHASLDEAGVPIRAGAHVGVIEERGDDVSGLAVHTASRIADLGEAGDTVVSAGVLDGSPGPGWLPLGAVELNGIAAPWDLYRHG